MFSNVHSVNDASSIGISPTTSGTEKYLQMGSGFIREQHCTFLYHITLSTKLVVKTEVDIGTLLHLIQGHSI